MFVMSADMVFSASERVRNVDALVRLIDHACDAAEASVRERWTNCGCYHELPWVRTLLGITRGQASRSPAFPWRQIFKLLDSLDKNVVENLLTGTCISDLKRLRTACEEILEHIRLVMPYSEANAPPIEESIRAIMQRTPFPPLPVTASPVNAVPETAEKVATLLPPDENRHIRRLSSASERRLSFSRPRPSSPYSSTCYLTSSLV